MRKEILIKKLKKHERSQAWLSRKLNLSAMAVCKWYKGSMPIPDNRAKQIERWLQ